MQVRDNHILANGQLGIGGGDGHTDIQVEGNEIASNNQAGFDPLWEAGGTKFWATTNLVVRGNTVHHNLGPGLWTDTDNRGTLYENNIVEDNRGSGIFHEVSYAAVIRNNSLRRNGEDSGVWSGGAGILISASSDVEVYGNLVEDNANAIVGMQQNRGSGPFGPYLVRNLYVHDNTLRMAVGLNGIIEDVGNSAPFTSRNNRWQSNTYYLGTNRSYFAWLGIRTETEWQNYGNDTTGMFLR